jgi:hypothetical protein
MNDFYTVLSAAVNDFIVYGYDDEQRLKQWVAKLRFAAARSLIPNHKMEQEIARALNKAFDRLVIRGGLVNKDVSRFTIDKLKPQLRQELQRRIYASTNLIKENREEAINSTLRRFQGWATSIPDGGSKAVDKVAEKTKIKKDLASIRFKQNRVIIDQTHKLIGAINEVVATDAGALGLIWHSKWRQAGYDYREDHKERDEKIYLLRDTWAIKAGLLKPINGYYDQITAVGEEIFCSCHAQYIYNLRRFPEEFLTEKGKIHLQSKLPANDVK